MAPARYSGVNRERAPRAGNVPTGVERDPFVARRLNNTVFVLDGSDAGSGVTTVELEHGGIAVLDIGIPASTTMTNGQVAVISFVDGSPIGDVGQLTLQVRAPNSTAFVDVATFDFLT